MNGNNRNVLYRYLPAIAAAALLVITGCTDDTTTAPTTDDGTQKIEVLSGQTPDNGKLVINKVVADQAGWVVIHRDNGSNAPTVPAIIGKVQVSAGTNSNIAIMLDSTIQNGEKLWAMLHVDDGLIGTYEFNGASTPDQPVTENGEIVMTPFTIQQTNPTVAVEDQTLKDGEVVIKSVNASENGWIVIHRTNEQTGTFGEVIGQTAVNPGVNSNVVVKLDSSASFSPRNGDKLWAMLHVDRGTEGKYEFPGADIPVTNAAGDIVMMPFTVSGATTASVSVSNQAVSNNQVNIALVNAKTVGWIVIHEDNGGQPKVPETIGRSRVMIGSNSNVKITLEKSVTPGAKLWAMLHTDTGIVGAYEFSGTNGIDPPETENSMVVMQSFVVQ